MTQKKILLLSISLAIMLAWLLLLTYFLSVHDATINRISKQYVNLAIAANEEGTYNKPLVDILGKKLYLYDAGLSLPLNALTSDVRYSIVDQSLQISLSGAIGKQHVEDTTTSPTCDQIVRLSKIKVDTSDMTYAGELPTEKNGFKYLYRHDPCPFFTEDTQNKLLDAAKQIDTF